MEPDIHETARWIVAEHRGLYDPSETAVIDQAAASSRDSGQDPADALRGALAVFEALGASNTSEEEVFVAHVVFISAVALVGA